MGLAYKLTQEEIEWCRELGFEIWKNKGGHYGATKNSMNFLKGKPPWHRSVVGIYGEKAYSLYSGYPVNDKILERGDGGADFPDGAQAKGSERDKMPNLMFPIKQFDRLPAKFYVLVWVWLPYVKLLGWMKREKVIQVRRVDNYGYGPCYVASNRYLNPLPETYHVHYWDRP